MIAPLSPSYREARAAFLDAAHSAGARLTAFAHPRTGLHGEDLYIDVAEVGPATNDRVVLVVSGTHGVEGYCGSALQRTHLSRINPTTTEYDPRLGGGTTPSAPTLVFVHALNPFGFSWVRRVNEDNIDLNRNFIDWSKPAPSNDDYDAMADMLVPDSWDSATQDRTLLELMDALARFGMPKMQQIIQGGQFRHPTGVFYGGSGPAWSHCWLREFIASRFARVQRAAILDLHTGLGPWGHGSLLSSAQAGSPEHLRQVKWWGDVTADDASDSVSAQVAGGWLSTVAQFCPSTEVTEMCIEYGTVDGISVLQSLRADAVLHAYGDPTSASADAIRTQVRAAFADDNPEWIASCWRRYESVATSAVRHLHG